jgi:hypothetical protein
MKFGIAVTQFVLALGRQENVLRLLSYWQDLKLMHYGVVEKERRVFS